MLGAGGAIGQCASLCVATATARGVELAFPAAAVAAKDRSMSPSIAPTVHDDLEG